MTYFQLVQCLQQNANATYNEFNTKIINSSVPTIGCTVPFLRKLSKQFTVQQVLEFPIHEFYEVDMLVAMVVTQAKLPCDSKRQLLWNFAKTIENWAVCDTCVVKRIDETEKEQFFQTFCEMAKDERPFVARYGIVNLLNSFLDDRWLSNVFAICLQVVAQGYYVDMAVAWLLATAMAKNPTKTKEFMQNEGREGINAFCYNKALQKIRESFRISSEDKSWSKTMKK